MLSLDEAIRHAEEVAKENEEIALYTPVEMILPDRSIEECEKCAAEHRQLAEWLKELKLYKSAVEAIREEIKETAENDPDIAWGNGLLTALDIIDRYKGVLGINVGKKGGCSNATAMNPYY